VALFAKEMPKIGQKHQFSKNTCKVVLCICRNSIYVAPPCEWIFNTLSQTVPSTEDLMTIVTLLVTLLVLCDSLGGSVQSEQCDGDDDNGRQISAV